MQKKQWIWEFLGKDEIFCLNVGERDFELYVLIFMNAEVGYFGITIY